MNIIDFQRMVAELERAGVPVQALFHGGRGGQFSVPPQATPAPEPVEPQTAPMSPIPPAAPPMPTRNPGMGDHDMTRGYMPAGGFGATGPMSGTKLEQRLQEGRRPPSENPFVQPGLWEALTGRKTWFEPEAPMAPNAIPWSPTDEAIQTIALGALPIGRAVKGAKFARQMADQAFNPRQWQQINRSGMPQHLFPGRNAGFRNVQDGAVPRPGPTTPMASPGAPAGPQPSLTETLQRAHREALRNGRMNPGTRRRGPNVDRYSPEEMLRVQRAARQARLAKKTAHQLHRKGVLDYLTPRISRR